MSNSKPTSPPKLAQRFLKFFLKKELLEEVSGDLLEQYLAKARITTTKKAKLNYWFQVINYLRPFAIKNLELLNPLFMFRHNIKISLRHFQRNKSSFLINLVGLSTGLACVLLIFLWGVDEWKFDKFHSNGDRLYQLFENRTNNGSIFTTDSTPWPLAKALAEELPEVELASVATPFYWFFDQALILEDKSVRATGHYVDVDYFNIFSYPLLHGDVATVLEDQNAIVLSEKIALSLFGSTEKAMGQKLSFKNERDCLVTGVMKDIPSYSSSRFDFVLPVQPLIEAERGRQDWGNAGPNTFVVLKPDVDPVQFEAKIQKFIQSKTQEADRELTMVKYEDHYLYGNFENGKVVGGRIEYLRLFAIIAIFILLIACINFMNLSTARATTRSKEIGVKKSIGAERSNLIGQYLSESILISLIALLLPQFNLITGKELSLSFDPRLIMGALGITLLTGLLAGSYPALYLSSFKPIEIFKGKLSNSLGAIWARKGLVVFQFVLSVSFIVLVVVLYQQIEYVQNKHLGYDKDNVIYFDIEGKVRDNMETFISEVKNINGVMDASATSQSLIGGGNTSDIQWEGKDPNLIYPFRFRAGYDGLIEMMDFELVEGRGYPKGQATMGEAVFNESGIRVMGMEDPIGKTVKLGDSECKIVGVIKDFHFQGLQSEVEPLFFVYMPQYTQKIMLKIGAGKEKETLSQLQEFYSVFNPEFTFNYRFLDADYQQQYKAEERVALLSRYSAILAIIISCLGLFGLVSFSAQRRRKEISIRKVLGASEWSVVRLLGKDFSNMVLAAIIIAIPISYFMATSWLSDFAYKIDLKWWVFAGAGSAALLIAWITVGMQTLQAARVNPAEVLKSD